MNGMAATVLLVEDKRTLRELLRSCLERAGFTVLSTGSSAEAITLTISAAPDRGTARWQRRAAGPPRAGAACPGRGGAR